MALPSGFLPFDPNHDYDEDEPCSGSDESNENPSHDSISSIEDNNHEPKQNHHIGGGVILVS